jgi:hypothetical protein
MRWRRAQSGQAVRAEQARGQSRAREVFFRPPGSDPAPLIVFHHIEKTAGTSLRRVLRANLPPVDAEVGPDLRQLRYDPEAALRWYRGWYESLEPERRTRLCCVMSHTAGYVVPALDRPVEALVLVRGPVDRVLSFYFHKRRNHLRRRGPDASFNLLERVYETPFPQRPPRAWQQFFNWQSRVLLSIYHDISAFPVSAGPSPDADLWRARLRDLVEGTFFVGVQDRLEQYVGLLARRYGWQAFVPHDKPNPQPRASEGVPADVRDTILAHNWLDAELHQLCRQIQERRERDATAAGSAPERLAG